MLPPPFEVCDLKGNYASKQPITEDAIMKMANYLARQRLRKGRSLTSPTDSIAYLQTIFQTLPYETFGAIYLDQKNKIITFETLFKGTINRSAIYPRELVKNALSNNSSALILFHNHPSGDPTPSKEDLLTTQTIKTALDLVDIRLLDHIVIGLNNCISLAKHGNI